VIVDSCVFGDASRITDSVVDAYAKIVGRRVSELVRSALGVAYNGGHLATLMVQRCG
jgi:hypothetical protein